MAGVTIEYKGAKIAEMSDKEKKTLKTGGKYYVDTTYCDLPAGNYEFGADGKMLDGVVEKNGTLYYYVNGKTATCGLFKDGDDYYYSYWGGVLKTGGKYYVDTTYCDLPVGNYTFGAVDYTYAELFERGEIYMSFTLPLRSGDWLSCRIPLFFIILISAFIGGLVIMALKEGEYRFLSKRGCFFESKGDFVLEMRAFGNKLRDEFKSKN